MFGRGPAKINTAARNVRSLPKQRENTDLSDSNSKRFMNSPKPTFNGNKNKVNNITISNSEPGEFSSPQHEEISKYLSENWHKVCKECETSNKKGQESGPLWYKEKTPNPKLSDFEAFDLDEWWRERYLQKANAL
ncbi:hypothetical protein SNE40_010605 [Patella caerulea]|uniref:Uncharacterized protein n=1 Tax=Patella caerulea TaxID=87958 RepID=A0AAN8K1D8_PATCE